MKLKPYSLFFFSFLSSRPTPRTSTAVEVSDATTAPTQNSSQKDSCLKNVSRKIILWDDGIFMVRILAWSLWQSQFSSPSFHNYNRKAVLTVCKLFKKIHAEHC